jgi:uncharacterized protein DUF3421
VAALSLQVQQKTGMKRNGEALFVARAQLNGGLQPGKVRCDLGGAGIPFGGQEMIVTNYEVLRNPGNW